MKCGDEFKRYFIDKAGFIIFNQDKQTEKPKGIIGGKHNHNKL